MAPASLSRVVLTSNYLLFFRCDRGVCEACRQAGQYDVISHQLQQQRGDGFYQHVTGKQTQAKSTLSNIAWLYFEKEDFYFLYNMVNLVSNKV